MATSSGKNDVAVHTKEVQNIPSYQSNKEEMKVAKEDKKTIEKTLIEKTKGKMERLFNRKGKNHAFAINTDPYLCLQPK
jgi:hypothetical protein